MPTVPNPGNPGGRMPGPPGGLGSGCPFWTRANREREEMYLARHQDRDMIKNTGEMGTSVSTSGLRRLHLPHKGAWWVIKLACCRMKVANC